MFCDNIIIHSYPDSRYVAKAWASFRMGKKIKWRIIMRDVSAVLAYMGRHDFCAGVPYRVITHRGE